MDRLIAHNGGMPLELDDLVFIQKAFKGALKGILHEFARIKNGNIVLSGCEVTGTAAPYNVSKGFVMMDYEIYYFPAQTSTSPNVIVEPDISYDPAGNDVFFDGVSRDTYEIRRARVITTFTPPAFVIVSNENRLTYLMPLAMKDNWALTDFLGKKYTFQSSDFMNGATANSSYPPYAIKKNGRVTFYGSIDVPSNISPGTNILTLPAQLRKGLSVSGGYADIYLCSHGGSIVRLGVSSVTLKYFDVAATGASIGYGISLNQISYDIDNI